MLNPKPKFDPCAEESGSILDLRTLNQNQNMCWLLFNMYSENVGFGAGGLCYLGNLY